MTLGANGGLGMGAVVAQDLEGEREKGIARQDGCRLIESEVKGWTAAAYRVIVHRRQVVMNQRVAMDAFERGAAGSAHSSRTPNSRADSMRRNGLQAFAAAEGRIAHGLPESGPPGGTSDLAVESG